MEGRTDGLCQYIFFFNDTATTEIYTLSLHDALPIFQRQPAARPSSDRAPGEAVLDGLERADRPAELLAGADVGDGEVERSEEHTSELQSRQYLVCRLLLEKKNITQFSARDLLDGSYS